MKNKIIQTLLATVFISSAAFAAPSNNLKDYKFMTENFHPYQYMQSGKLIGASADLVQKTLKDLKLNNKIEMVLWDDGVKKLKNEDNTVLFSMNRTTERENLYKWSGPLFSDRMFLCAKKGSNLKIKNEKDLKAYKIAAVKDSLSESEALAKGVQKDKITYFSDYDLGVEGLLDGKVDLVPLSLAQVEKYRNQVEKVYKLYSKQAYVVFNKDTPDEVVKKFDDALKVNLNPKNKEAIAKRYHIIF